jgi:hypothetical protein
MLFSAEDLKESPLKSTYLSLFKNSSGFDLPKTSQCPQLMDFARLCPVTEPFLLCRLETFFRQF